MMREKGQFAFKGELCPKLLNFIWKLEHVKEGRIG